MGMLHSEKDSILLLSQLTGNVAIKGFYFALSQLFSKRGMRPVNTLKGFCYPNYRWNTYQLYNRLGWEPDRIHVKSGSCDSESYYHNFRFLVSDARTSQTAVVVYGKFFVCDMSA